MNNKRLTEIFSVVGSRNGYEEVTAEFSPFRDFKMKWTRTYKWISFEISDYLGDAPDSVMESLASVVYRKISGQEGSIYTPEVLGWLQSEDFVRDKQPVFVRRFRGLSLSTVGEQRDLRESYDRLVSAGLLERDPQLYMGWIRGVRGRAVGRSSVLMRVVAMSDILDNAELSDMVVDYCLYSQAAHVAMGFDPESGARGREYDEMLSRFPGRREAEAELRRIGMHI